jgi:hypothetical protein
MHSPLGFRSIIFGPSLLVSNSVSVLFFVKLIFRQQIITIIITDQKLIYSIQFQYFPISLDLPNGDSKKQSFKAVALCVAIYLPHFRYREY